MNRDFQENIYVMRYNFWFIFDLHLWIEGLTKNRKYLTEKFVWKEKNKCLGLKIVSWI